MKSYHAQICTQLASYCAQSRNFPFEVSSSLWKIDENAQPIPLLLLLRYAQQHKVLSSCIEALGEPLSAEAEPFIKRAKLEKGAKSLLLRQWQTIHEKFQSYAIPALIIKGPAASLQLYGDPFVREYTDLDILVYQDRWEPIVTALGEIGWEMRDQDLSSLQEKTSKFVMEGHHVIFVHKGSPFRMEVHRFLDKDDHPYGRSLQQIFSESQILSWGSYSLPTLSLIDHVELLIDHGTHHVWMLLHWLCDAVALLLVQDEALHSEIVHRVIQKRQELSIALMIELVTSLFPIEIPSAYKELTIKRRRTVQRLTRYCIRMLSEGGARSSSLYRIVYTNYRYQLSLASGFRNKLSVALRVWKIPQQDMRRLPLPPLLLPLHIILRPFFVFQRRVQKMREKRSGQ